MTKIDKIEHHWIQDDSGDRILVSVAFSEDKQQLARTKLSYDVIELTQYTLSSHERLEEEMKTVAIECLKRLVKYAYQN